MTTIISSFRRNLVTSRCLDVAIVAALLLAGLSAVLPAHADAYDDVGALMRSGRTADAMEQADKYLATRPQDPQMRFLKGMIQRDTGKIEDAMATFTRLTQDYPELPEPHNNLAVLYASRNEIDKARASLEMAVRANPEYGTAHENLGDVYVRLAATAFARAQQLGAGSATIAPKLNLIQQLVGSPKAASNSAQPPSSAGMPAGIPAVPPKGNAP